MSKIPQKKTIIEEEKNESKSEYEDIAFDQVIENKLNAENESIDLDDFYDKEFTDNGRSELLLDSLISDAISISVDLLFIPRKTYR
jgi:hypothetical protein